MARYSIRKINGYLTHANDPNGTNASKGKAFEDLISYIFSKIPGVEITARNSLNTFATEEIDISVWNNKKADGLHFLPNIFLIECKNWTKPVSSIELNWFASKLESRGRDFGILIANNGITGSPEDMTASHSIIARHLSQRREIIVINKTELLTFREPKDLIKIIKQKLCELTVSGTCI